MSFSEVEVTADAIKYGYVQVRPTPTNRVIFQVDI
jgi:hypothetical protein